MPQLRRVLSLGGDPQTLTGGGTTAIGVATERGHHGAVVVMSAHTAAASGAAEEDALRTYNSQFMFATSTSFLIGPLAAREGTTKRFMRSVSEGVRKSGEALLTRHTEVAARGGTVGVDASLVVWSRKFRREVNICDEILHGKVSGNESRPALRLLFVYTLVRCVRVMWRATKCYTHRLTATWCAASCTRN